MFACVSAQLSGKNELKADHVLVRHGAYARIRHPMYSAIFLVCIAQGLPCRL